MCCWNDLCADMSPCCCQTVCTLSDIFHFIYRIISWSNRCVLLINDCLCHHKEMTCELDTKYEKGNPQVTESASLPGGEFAEIMCVSSPRAALELQAQPVPRLQMSFITVQIWNSLWGMFDWLSLISFILANFQFSSWIFSFPVGEAKPFSLSLWRGNSNIACRLSLCKAVPIFLRQPSLTP